ncbi:helix-turn-helix transcriptional regulator [Streptomyces sp. SID3343]|uniref:helix-turn-helix domain-containing protein n=1 Tax=Streptomyces sp. SID3343 TaxID=2690260 RepID=UPI00136A8D49|nr:helix-turn-helix domain-containing protein [Streptomyces sp. SID3343]
MVNSSAPFGRELRRRRLDAGITLAGLAGMVHYSKGQLSKIERGFKSPGREFAAMCDATLGAGGALASLVPEPRSREVGTEKVASGDWSALDEDGRPALGRRRMLAGGAAAVVVGLGVAGSAAGAAHADAGDVPGVFRSMFEQYRVLGQTLDSQLVLPALIAQTRAVRELAGHSGPGRRDELLRLGSRYAEYVGWLVQESGDDAAALRWTERAVELAAAGGDPHLAAYARVRRALVTLYRGDAAQTVALAGQAQEAALPPRIRGLAAQREAQGHAVAGDYDATMRCLDRARVSFARDAEAGASAHPVGTTHLSDPVAMVHGWCLYDLGRPRAAAEIIGRQLEQVPAHALRTRARFGMRHALAHAAAGEVDHACELTDRLLDTAEAVNSATVASDIRRMAHTLARHPRNASARALLPELSTHPRFATS